MDGASVCLLSTFVGLPSFFLLGFAAFWLLLIAAGAPRAERGHGEPARRVPARGSARPV